MTPISSRVAGSALALIRQGTEEPKPKLLDQTIGMIAAENGLDVETTVNELTNRAEMRISESIFSVNHIDINERKLKLFEEVGEALNVDQDDFDTVSAYASALRVEVAKILRDPMGEKIIREIEEELGLDELGVSLDEVISAIANPDGEADAKLTEALDKKYNGDRQSAKDAIEHLQLNELGLYGPAF
ncbi:hypothetical protein [Notoacmeibacter ruber]|uniref:Uncharacterized protein n=1 Tax=Notoacmeibacter ruber TaxID=2670375 RepID=A0A3L7JDB4_9HYPH|nr:hypothetical protein [Notoacmeibacter ruber]RLQ88454.1 hypothetical protein D8780_09785 [Notoacmeibacter ruber]